jgi:hypothetical protein
VNPRGMPRNGIDDTRARMACVVEALGQSAVKELLEAEELLCEALRRADELRTSAAMKLEYAEELAKVVAEHVDLAPSAPEIQQEVVDW